MPAYEFTGSAPVTYTWGVVAPGAIAYFAGRPPDGDWTEYVAPATASVAEEGAVDTTGEQPGTDGAESAVSLGDPMTNRPNKAASAEDWRIFADVHGGFQEATGKSPMDPATTRKEIVDHYTGTEGADQ